MKNFVALFLVVFLLSCAKFNIKDQPSFTSIPNYQAIAESHFNTDKQGKRFFDNETNLIGINWESMRLFKNEKQELFLTAGYNNPLSERNRYEIIFHIDTLNLVITNYYLLQYEPTDEYFKENRGRKLYEKFSGRVNRFSPDGVVIYFTDVNEGVVVQNNLYPEKQSFSVPSNNSKASAQKADRGHFFKEAWVYDQFIIICPNCGAHYRDGEIDELADRGYCKICGKCFTEKCGFSTTIPSGGVQPIDGCSGCDLSKPTVQDIKNQIKDKPFALFGDLDCDIVQKWLETAKRQIQQAQIDKLNTIVNTTTTRPGITTTTVARLQDINNAYSTVVNMDYFPIHVGLLPVIDGQRMSPAQFLELLRKNINSFINNTYATFSPYSWYGVNEATLWNTSNPLGAVIAIDIAGPDNGSVIVTQSSNSMWTFSTIFDPKYGTHPVSGHRDFGYVPNDDGSYTFYTRGVDRLTTGFDTAMQDVAFFAADQLWKSFQQNISNFINNNQGYASIGQIETERPDWQQIIDVIEGKKPLSTLSSDCDE